jgi:aldose 1-epimerase
MGSVIELGAAVRDLVVRRHDGTMQRVVLGLKAVADYFEHSPHMGAICGRFANRIRHGRFVLDGQVYRLPLNQDGKHTLHGGGQTGLGKSLWTLLYSDSRSATLAIHSPAGGNGFPGAMTTTCRYSLLAPATLRVELWGVSDAPTIVNLCHHSYFNLDGGSDILDHTLEVHADLFTPIDADLIPVGSLESVAGTAFDFRTARTVRRLGADGMPVRYDHNFMLRRDRREASGLGLELWHAATLASAKSGVSMQLWTTEPACQVYDGGNIKVRVAGLDGVGYGAHAGLCLEPQHVPNSPNLAHFPSTVLRPGQVYRQISEIDFPKLRRVATQPTHGQSATLRGPRSVPAGREPSWHGQPRVPYKSWLEHGAPSFPDVTTLVPGGDPAVSLARRNLAATSRRLHRGFGDVGRLDPGLSCHPVWCGRKRSTSRPGATRGARYRIRFQ